MTNQIPLSADHINALFELVGAAFVWLNVRELFKRKYYAGVCIESAAIFTVWGFWNLYYYPHLGQFWSSLAALLLASGNTAWVVLALYYTRKGY